MSKILKPGNQVLFMKVGVHATETIEEILERKKEEFNEAGRVFWGYGGSTCHPKTMVQPFGKQAAEQNKEINIIMQKMDSKHSADPILAREYSEDGIDWKTIPKGVKVKGSRYALVLGEIKEEDAVLDISSLEVAVGPSRGRSGEQYLIGQADKGCFEIKNEPSGRQSKTCHIDLVAPILDPYAVFLR